MNNKLGGLVGKVEKYDAVFSLVNGDMYQKADGTMHYTGGKTAPSDAEIDAEIIRLQSEWDAHEYARKREAEYTSIQDVTVALAEKAEGDSTMWDKITAERAAVKLKYPKPE